MDNLIEVNNLIKDYGHKRGVFDISFKVQKGEVYGFLGPNGAGKSTTIRHLMGFSKPQSGSTKVFGMESFDCYFEILKNVGYIPGEIALPSGLTGWEFIDMSMKMKDIKSHDMLKRLLDIFDLDPSGSTKRMSLGVKRKLAIVTAFMGNPDLLILDEPTSGLDPIMQDVFIDFIKLQKKEGKTIMLSSHMFNEIDATCDRIAIIKNGFIVSEFVANDLKHATQKNYTITFKSKETYDAFLSENEVNSFDNTKLTTSISCEDSKINQLISRLSNEIVQFSQKKETLEDYFMNYYVESKDFGGVL